MPTISLTQRAVDALKPPAHGRFEYFDRNLPGFGLRVGDSGRKTWFVMYRVLGRKVRETIGPLTLIPNIVDARARARESISKAQSGVHPIADRKEQLKAADKTSASFRAVSELYLERHAKRNTKPSTWKELKRQLDVDVNPRWGDRPMGSITRRDIIELLDAISDRGSPVQANRTLARLRTFFNWSVEREIIPVSPAARMKLPTTEKPRSRTLTDDEIRTFWVGCDKLGWPFGPLFKLLLLTAQRRDEVGAMEWSELDVEKRIWTIPRERAKNDRMHEVHLSELAIEVIDALPRTGELVFTTNGKRPVSGFSKAKERLDAQMLRLKIGEAENGSEKVIWEDWILHDLRRTTATGMARLNVPPHVVDRILNHVSGTTRGVAAVYNRHAYLEERKTALETWGRYVESLTRPIPTKIVQFVAGR